VANSTASIRSASVRQFERPVQDEWGIFDPKQAGLEALLRKLLSPGGDHDITPQTPAPAAK
jgi:hypothetical protein